MGAYEKEPSIEFDGFFAGGSVLLALGDSMLMIREIDAQSWNVLNDV